MGDTLPGGLRLRAARPADLDQISALLTDRGDADDAVDLRLVVEDPDAGYEACAVVLDGDTVVSTATLLDETLVLDGCELPAGQVEMVATARSHEGRGLVRALMGWAHDRSAERGHVLQVLHGIPYFYRQFGYEYAIPRPTSRPVVGDLPEGGAGLTVREAVAADVPELARLQEADLAGVGLSLRRSAACWRWLVARPGSTQWVVSSGDTIVGAGRDDGDQLAELAGSPGARLALLRHVRGLRPEIEVTGRDAADHLGPGSSQAEADMIRIPDPVALFERLRPVFGARLARAGVADLEVVVSLFRSHLRFGYADGVAGPVSGGGVMQAPGVVGGAGIAPDQLAAVLFGPHGIAGLSTQQPDVYPGRNRDVMTALFPPVDADVRLFYLP
ncbi:GNAT family N-acetyltransferase [Longispora sp. NPDC051575]|uniref:GNAT family N-acetyltransferase n=1 Tax=Longispora sp. NPDC051575 TaxID=3154943 RepID=UPI003412FF3B